jgi:soluble lytic murein transglycosylase-like protein
LEVLMIRARRIPALLCAVFGSVGLLRAEQAVVFEDGRTMAVERVEIREGVALLVLPGGGEIAVPAGRVVRWQELAAPAPPARREPAPPAADSWREAAGHYAEAIEAAAERHGLDPALLVSLAQVESAFDPRAVSSKGASGLLQLMPDTARRFGVRDAFDPAQNLEGGARYLSWLLERFGGRTDLALAGYNAGEGAVERHRGIPPYRETRHYVDRVMAGAAMLARSAP